MPAGRVFRQTYGAQHQFRPRFFATPDPVTGSAADLLDDATSAASGTVGDTGSLAVALADTVSAAVGTFTDATTPVDVPAVRPSIPMPRLNTRGTIHRITATANLGGITAHTTPTVEFADEELIEIA